MNGRTILTFLLVFLVIFVLPFSVDAQKFPKGKYKYQPKPVAPRSRQPMPTDDSGLKFIHGSDNFESIRHFPKNSQMYNLGKKVAYLSMNGWECSGFLVGPDLLMTNHHCLFDGDTGIAHRLQDFKVYMDYYHDFSKGDVSAGVTQILKSSKELDYALLLLDTPIGNIYGWLGINTRTNRLDQSINVKIIQHPDGNSKKISRRDSSITQVFADRIHYRADTQGGSSGSPVFSGIEADSTNEQTVIAIHRAGMKGYANEGVLMKNIVPEIRQWLPNGQYLGPIDQDSALITNPGAWAAARSKTGYENLKSGRYEAAVEDYTDALRLNPNNHNDNNSVYYGFRGDANYELGRYEAAIEDYTDAIRLNPNLRYYYGRGLAKYDLGRTKAAIEDFTKVIQRNPKVGNSYYWRGRAKYQLRRYEAAIEDYTDAIRLKAKDGKNGNAYYWRGYAKYRLGRHAAALADFTDAIRLNPKNGNAYSWRGGAKYKLGRYEAAITDFTEAIRLNAKTIGRVNTYYYRGSAKYNLGRYETAITDFTEAIRLKPKDGDAYYWRGYAKYNLGRYETAITDFTETIRLDPKNKNGNTHHAYQRRGDAKFNLRRYEAAIDDYTKAIRLKSKNGDAYYWRGHAKYKLDRYDAALDDFAEVIRFNPKEANGYYWRGHAKHKLGRYDAAIDDYTKAIRLKPKDGDAYYWRGNMKRYGLKRFQEARKDYTTALNLAQKAGDKSLIDRIQKEIQSLPSTQRQ